jgi:tetratricopeptide (TPR) repeat protein
LSAPTLRASIDAALDALPPALVHALAALAIFEGAFGPDAAAALLGAEAPSALDALRARALILRADGAAHRLHEEVRAAVHERGVGEAAHQRLARWLAEHAPGWAHDVHEGEPTAALRALAMHAGDLERALRGSLHRDPASAARIALGLDAWWLPRGPRDQHEAVLRQGLDAAQRADDPGLEVELQRAHARALFLRGRLEEARAACVAPLQAARRSGAVRQRIAIAHVASAIARELGDPGAARALAERTLEEARAIGERDAEVRALHNLACAAAAADQHTEARATFLAALALARDVGARRVEALCLANLAIVHEQLGELELARARCAQALAAFAALDDRLMRTKLRMREARLSIRAGALDEAARSLRAATLEATRSGDRAALLEGHLARAELHRARGQHAAARAEADEARALAQHLHARGAVREVEAFLAALAPIDPATSAHTITVAVDGSSFALDEGPTVELDRRPTLRRVLAALAARHAAGERGASVSDLVAAGWPGEKMSAESGAERVYASIGALRRLVLAAVLVRREDGYALEGRIELVEP